MSPPRGGAGGNRARAAAGAAAKAEEPLEDHIQAARDKLKERFGQGDANRVGGKGSARRKKVGVHRSAVTDDKKLQIMLKKMNLASIPGIEEVMMYKDDNTVLQFNNPKVQAAPASNTYVINGAPETKELEQVLSRVMTHEAVMQHLKAAVENAPKGATPSALVSPAEPSAAAAAGDTRGDRVNESSQGKDKSDSKKEATGTQPKDSAQAGKPAEEEDADSDSDDEDDSDDSEDSDDVPATFEQVD